MLTGFQSLTLFSSIFQRRKCHIFYVKCKTQSAFRSNLKTDVNIQIKTSGHIYIFISVRYVLRYRFMKYVR